MTVSDISRTVVDISMTVENMIKTAVGRDTGINCGTELMPML